MSNSWSCWNFTVSCYLHDSASLIRSTLPHFTAGRNLLNCIVHVNQILGSTKAYVPSSTLHRVQNLKVSNTTAFKSMSADVTND